MTSVQGRCPACASRSLTVSPGGFLVCTESNCPDPGAADYFLQGGDAALVALLGGGGVGRILAGLLTDQGVTYAKLPTVADSDLLAIPGVSPATVAHIRKVFPAPPVWREHARQADERAETASIVGTRYMVRAEEAEAEVARLRAGEEPGYDPARVPTPGQWIARWNASSAEECLEVAQRVSEDSARAARCFRMDHETRIVAADKMLAARLRVMNRSEATVARVRTESARIRSITPTWGPVADIIDAALREPIREQRERPTRPDGTPYGYAEITAEGWGFCDGCRMWSTATSDRPHQCAETHMQGPIDGKENGDV